MLPQPKNTIMQALKTAAFWGHAVPTSTITIRKSILFHTIVEVCASWLWPFTLSIKWQAD